MSPAQPREPARRRDPLHDAGPTSAVWTTVNAAEAMPGVATPLGWTWFFEACELGLRGAFADLGAIPARDVQVPEDLDHRFIAMFYGHFAGNLDMMRFVGDQMPGSSGDAVEEQYFATARHDIPSTRRLRRVPVVLAKLPVNAWRARRVIERRRHDVDAWWRRAVAPGSTDDDADARRVFAEAMLTWRSMCHAHTTVSMVAQGLFEQVRRLCATAGQPGLELRLVSAVRGVAETETIADLWRVANGRLSMDAFLSAHGFHGPGEGELSSRSWREDPTPLEALLAAYRDHDPPEAALERRREERTVAVRELRAGLHGRDRLVAGPVLRLARTYIPLREQGRATFLRAYDVARCMARRIGDHLVARGLLDEPDDVFSLTVDEMLGDLPTDTRAEVAFRRERRAQYLRLDLPERWQGSPVPIELAATEDEADALPRQVRGIGASPGCLEGRALVVVDPLEARDVRKGDVLVCRTTDPSWASLFFLVSACVIDIGGPMSHGAILARELELPCVINTRDGTRALRTGDWIRVDGGTGTVDVLTSSVR